MFINEIHYQNSGADVGEAIEVAGPAGTDLDGWSLVLYDGSGGAPYATIPLIGILPDQENGFGTLAFWHDPIQDGGDGIALVDGTTVVQFLSYGLFPNPFTAVGGPAHGLLSDNIRVNQPPDSTPAGHSLQLIVPPSGTSGTTYGDFVWTTATPNTFGDINFGQVFAVPEPLSANELKVQARDVLEALGTTGDAADDEAIATAIMRIEQSINPDWWDGASALDPGGWQEGVQPRAPGRRRARQGGGPNRCCDGRSRCASAGRRRSNTGADGAHRGRRC